MSITREQLADLHPGDVVELTRNGWPDGTVVRGPLYAVGGWLYVAEHSVKSLNGSGTSLGASYSLTVVSRAPRPLYVNHDRALETERQMDARLAEAIGSNRFVQWNDRRDRTKAEVVAALRQAADHADTHRSDG